MSVTQISRIQQRRGKKNTEFGFPQLASGELGWAIDTQELYIGNGAVSEGAPYVGNSKILTEHDDILQFVSLYQYQKNNPVIDTGEFCSDPVQRSLQDRLDDIVSVKAFGVIGDGVTDNTDSLQRAIDQLFLNDATKNNPSSRVVLYIEPGEYIISNELRIPPFAHIIGSGIDSTIIHQTRNYAIFRTVDSNSTPGSYTQFGSQGYTNTRPRYILISGLTLETDVNKTILYLDNTDSTSFDKIRFLGSYQNIIDYPNVAPIPLITQNAVEIRGTSDIFCSTNILFNFCIFDRTGYGIYSEMDQNNINFNNCLFHNLYDAINIGGGIEGATNNNITNCCFDYIVRYSIYIKKGYGNNSSNNKFVNVGNDNLGYLNATHPIIKFDTDHNQSIGDYFERNKRSKDQNISSSLAFIPNIQSPGLIYDNDNFHKNIVQTGALAQVLLRFPLSSSGRYIIDYVINKNTNGVAIRSGTMTISVFLDVDTGNHGVGYNNQSVSSLIDDFNYVGSSNVENIIFSVGLKNYKNIPQITTPDTLVINISNLANGIGVMNYTYRMLSQ
jgi:Pectate lyase superfamily protein/Major tropism determinant N-terminal domain